MGGTSSQQKKKISLIIPQTDQNKKNIQNEHENNSQDLNQLPEIPIQSLSPTTGKNVKLRNYERVLSNHSQIKNDKYVSSLSYLSETSEQEQVVYHHRYNSHRVSRFGDMKNQLESLNSLNNQPTQLNKKNTLQQNQKDIHPIRSNTQYDARSPSQQLAHEPNQDDFNLAHTERYQDDNNDFIEQDTFSKFSHNQIQNKNEKNVAQNIFKQIKLCNKFIKIKEKNQFNLFSNEADMLYKSKGGIREQERSQQRNISQTRDQSSNNITTKDSTLSNQSQKNINSISNFSRHKIFEQNQSMAQKDQESSKNKPQKDINPQFKHEIIQVSENKSNREFFKKGNIYLAVQDENTNRFDKNSSENIIAELITNNISVTDYLVSDRTNINEKIILNKKKKQFDKQFIDELNKQTKAKKNNQFANDNSTTSQNTAITVSSTNLDNNNKQSLNSFSSSIQQQQKNIIISYSQDWENIRRGAVVQSIK